MTAARELPGALGAELMESARVAFTSGMTTVALVGGAVLAAAVAVLLRQSESQPELVDA